MNEIAQQLEALLFTAGEAVPFSELAQLTNLSEEHLKEYITELSEGLHEHGLSLLTTDTHAELVTSASVAPFLAQFQKEESKELSKAALETLSIIAYRGPIPRFDIDAIRGVDSRHMLRQLFAKGLIRQIQHSGKAPQYDITEEFLSHMGVRSKQELPDFATLSSHESIEKLLKSAV